MTDPLQSSLRIAGSGLEAQSVRHAHHLRKHRQLAVDRRDAGRRSLHAPDRIVRQRLRSSDGRVDGAGEVDRSDNSPFKVEHDPGNPAADAAGFVKLPNVDVLTELADMREANRTYEANLQVAKQSAELLGQTVNLLKDA